MEICELGGVMTGRPSQLIIYLATKSEDECYELKKHKEKRTLTANSYYWALLGKLSKYLKTSNVELHERMIKRYSHNISYFSTLSEVNIKEFGVKYFEEESTFMKNGKEFKSYKIFQPSSEMNKSDFCDLVDGLVSECKECNIETLTPSQLEELKNLLEDK